MSVLRYIPVESIVGLACAVLLVAAVVVLATPAGRRVQIVERLLRVVFVGYVVVLLVVTTAGGGSGGVNLVPFAGIRTELGNVNRELAFANVFGNVIMFVPVPILARVTWVPTWPRALACGVGLSVVIEVVQLGAGRSADVDDVILNSAGALVGAVVGIAAATAVGHLRGRHRRAAGSVELPAD